MATVEVNVSDISFDRHEYMDVLDNLDGEKVLEWVQDNFSTEDICEGLDTYKVLEALSLDTKDVLDALEGANGRRDEIKAWIGEELEVDTVNRLMAGSARQAVIAHVLSKVTLLEIGLALVAISTPKAPEADDLVTILNTEEDVLVLR
jgi:hypothetical protein